LEARYFEETIPPSAVSNLTSFSKLSFYYASIPAYCQTVHFIDTEVLFQLITDNAWGMGHALSVSFCLARCAARQNEFCLIRCGRSNRTSRRSSPRQIVRCDRQSSTRAYS